MKQLRTYLNVTERDVDLLILEELHISENFANWFASCVLGSSVQVKMIGVWHSVSDAMLGESDLVYLYQSSDRSSQAILIENKIDAQAQPAQGVRYQKRGEKGILDGHWVDFKTCLIAPQEYIEKNLETYDSRISYENIMSYFNELSDSRCSYRASFIKEAIEKNRRGYQSVTSEEMTQFAEKYLRLVALNYPELNPEQPKPRAALHTWIHFYPLPNDKNTKIIHQIYGNTVKILFSGQASRYDEILAKFEQYQDSNLTVKKSGKSVTVEVSAPEIDPLTQEFDDVLKQVNDSIAIALNLKEKLFEKCI